MENAVLIGNLLAHPNILHSSLQDSILMIVESAAAKCSVHVCPESMFLGGGSQIITEMLGASFPFGQ